MARPSPISRTGWRLAVGVAGLAALLLAVRLFAPMSTPAIRGAHGSVEARSIAVAERWPINGVAQAVVIRGRDRANPVMIWVSDLWCETPLFRHFNGALEAQFTVVYWCQRYSGQSFDPWAPKPAALNLDQYVADLDVLVARVRQRLNKDKVILVGHSSGTALGLLYVERYPEHLAAYVGVGQIVNQATTLARGYNFAMAQARLRSDQAAMDDLERLGPPPYPRGGQSAVSRWVIAFGGAFHNDLTYNKLALTALAAPETNWRDVAALGLADCYTVAVNDQLSRIAFDQPPPVIGTPVLFAFGRYDHRTDPGDAAAFLAAMTAPQKQFIWFENAAHSPPFEEPDAFNAWMIRQVRTLAIPAP